MTRLGGGLEVSGARMPHATRRPGARALSLAIVIAMVAGCDMSVAPEPGPQQPAEVTTGNGTPAQTRIDWQYPASVDADFTGSERRALSRLHAEGWNGDGVAIVVRDEFNADGSPSHGEAVLNIARHSFGGSTAPGTVDALPVEQSGTTNQGVLEVWAAGNVQRPMGRSPADAVPAIEHNEFVHLLAQAFDFTEVMHTETPCTGSGCRNGLLHAKSGVLVVGAVDYRRSDLDWTLAHSDAHGGTHSARAGHARNAFLVTPDDNREETFAGTSFAAPRVSAALAILKQKCPDLSYRRLSFILLKSARDLGEPGVDAVYGFGLLDLEQAFEQAESLAAMFESYDSTIPATVAMSSRTNSTPTANPPVDPGRHHILDAFAWMGLDIVRLRGRPASPVVPMRGARQPRPPSSRAGQETHMFLDR